MLRKSAISVEKNLEGQFLSPMFLVKKNGGESSSDQSEGIEKSGSPLHNSRWNVCFC